MLDRTEVRPNFDSTNSNASKDVESLILRMLWNVLVLLVSYIPPSSPIVLLR